MTAERIADVLHARYSRGGYIARCPAHEDHSPSLSICEGDDGRVLLHCFAGCTVESICDALDIHVSDLFQRKARNTKTPQRPAIEREIAASVWLTPRERFLKTEVTIVYVNEKHLDEGIARAFALAVEGDLVQCVLQKDGE